MEVTLIAKTEFLAPEDVLWKTDARGGEALVEFAGRSCYQSWSKPNPATATNAGYIKHIIDVGHGSVLEHGVATFYITGVSRSLTHELVRHRHFSYSQLSQRFVDESDAEFVYPPALREGDNWALDSAIGQTRIAYEESVKLLQEKGLTRKQAREAARCILPNMTETKIVVTGNYRAWRHFIDMRATQHADAEIRELAIEILKRLKFSVTNVFQDYIILQNGTASRLPS